ncbi:hypothetical protein [Micromonospora sp. CPCC 206061]|uniref:hypothetical protein n=1 Tax=Micromonospora sp. CPCC 206061 TaxID=3122410 RepID=UPI002FF14081
MRRDALWRVSVAALAASPFLLIATAAHADGDALAEIGAASPAVGAAVAPYADLIEPTTSISQPLPASPTDALADVAGALSVALGLAPVPGDALRTAGLPDPVAGRLANVLTDLLVCQQATAVRFAAVPPSALPALLATGAGVDSAVGALLRACADELRASSAELELTLAGLRPAQAAAECAPLGVPSVDAWPVLRLESGCDDNTYANDYLLTVDAGGADTYANNAGSNVVDPNFAPAGSAVPGLRGTGPARGCQRAIPGLAAADCVPAAAVLLDLHGDDTYGVKQSPDHDAGCTLDPVVRRMMTGGAGFLGVGLLRDAGGSDDAYIGKTGSLGAGHVFGVGILSDDGGDDAYSSVRNSQGFALVGGFGLLRDEAGADRYDYYMPAPIDPAASNQTEGAGGVRDDEGEGLCDRIPRFTQGAANVLPGSIALLIDDEGADAYHGAFAGEFIGPIQNPSTRAGSLGFGNNQGVAVMLDRAGLDSYTVEGEPPVSGVSARGNAVTVLPGNDASSAGGGAGLFIDQ